jgi:hypothetical protein
LSPERAVVLKLNHITARSARRNGCAGVADTGAVIPPPSANPGSTSLSLIIAAVICYRTLRLLTKITTALRAPRHDVPKPDMPDQVWAERRG